MMMLEGIFDDLWLVDFEYQAEPGATPAPVCLVAMEARSGRIVRFWREELLAMRAPPYPISANSVVVAYYASAEIGCHLALGWPVPLRILDLYAEFRALTNGLDTPNRWGLLEALIHFGQDAIGATEKKEMRELILRGEPWSAAEREAILDYCQSDVDALARLLPVMLPLILTRQHGLGHALLRGRFMAAAAAVERNGVPIDVATLARLRAGWSDIQDRLIAEIDKPYGVFDGRTFKASRFAGFLARNNIPWPRLPSGALDLRDDTFREMARAYPLIAPLRELRVALSQMRAARRSGWGRSVNQDEKVSPGS